MIETWTRGKGTIDCGLQGSVGTLDDVNPTRLSKWSQGCPLTVYRLIEVEMDIKDVNDFNLWTKKLGCNYWSTYTKSGIGGIPVTSLYCDPIGVDNRSLGVKN